MYRHFLPTYRQYAIRGEAWIRAPRSHKHTDMREFTRFHRLAKVSAIDIGARVVHSRSGINTRGFCKANQSQLFFTSVCTLSLSLVFSVLPCCLLYSYFTHQYTVISWSLQFGGPNETFRNISSESQFSEKRIESPLDAYGYRVLSVIYWVLDKYGSNWETLRNLSEINSLLQLLHKSKVSRWQILQI